MREKCCIICFYIEDQKAFEMSSHYITLIRIRNLPGVILGLVTEYRETVQRFVSLTM